MPLANRHAVLPCGAGLVGEWKPAELADHLGIGLFFVDDACALVARLEKRASQMRVGQARRVPQQIVHAHLVPRGLYLWFAV